MQQIRLRDRKTVHWCVYVLIGGNVDLDDHVQKSVGVSREASPQRNRLSRIARYGDTHQILVADNSIGGVELDPATDRQEDPQPCVGMTAPDRRQSAAVFRGTMDVTRDELRS